MSVIETDPMNPRFGGDGIKDAVAFARALANDDRDGAYAIYQGRTMAQQMSLAISLAMLLDLAIPDGDEAWSILLSLAGGEER